MPPLAKSSELPFPGADEPLRIGLVGCGHRGRGAVEDALQAAPGVKLVAVADAFADKTEKARTVFADARFAGRVDLPQERCFSGLDAYQKLLATDVEYVLLASPPGFRPLHLTAAIAAGKHVFAEKPIAVDGPGVRACLAAHAEAKRRNLGVVGGTMRRHDPAYIEAVSRLRAGAIGSVVAARTYWNQGAQWVKPREKGWSDAEWQIRNWFYFTWLSGDQICEQQIHNLDVINWVLGTPHAAIAVGGRQQRTAEVFGHVFDHMTVDFEYAEGVHVACMSRQMEKCDNDMSDAFVGTKGRAHLGRGTGHAISVGARTVWQSRNTSELSAYVLEHRDFIKSLRAGRPLQELERLAHSNLTCVMGRMAAYTGQRVTWKQALDSQESLYPSHLALGPLPVAKVAVPGATALL